MWLSKQNVNLQENQSADIGDVTISGSRLGIYTDMEQRNVPLYAPGGYFWRPKVGQKILVIKKDDTVLCATGTEVTDLPSNLAGGEICLKADGAASIFIKNNGSLILSGNMTLKGNVNIEGSLSINGTPIM